VLRIERVEFIGQLCERIEIVNRVRCGEQWFETLPQGFPRCVFARECVEQDGKNGLGAQPGKEVLFLDRSLPARSTSPIHGLVGGIMLSAGTGEVAVNINRRPARAVR
jgi:hypothetical protein